MLSHPPREQVNDGLTRVDTRAAGDTDQRTGQLDDGVVILLRGCQHACVVKVVGTLGHICPPWPGSLVGVRSTGSARIAFPVSTR